MRAAQPSVLEVQFGVRLIQQQSEYAFGASCLLRLYQFDPACVILLHSAPDPVS